MRWVLIAVVLLMVSCREKPIVTSSLQFNIDSLLNFHLKSLKQTNISLTKSATVNSQTTTKTLSGLNVDWESEFQTFRSISQINKPIYNGKYHIESNRDNKSNLSIKTWVANEPLPIKTLKVYYLNKPPQIKRIEATLEQSTFLYSSTKQLTIDFGVVGNTLPEHYKVSGRQRFILGNEEDYSLDCTVQLN